MREVTDAEVERFFAVYTKANCPWCALAKDALSTRGFKFSVIDMSDDQQRQAFYERVRPVLWVGHVTMCINVMFAEGHHRCQSFEKVNWGGYVQCGGSCVSPCRSCSP